LIEKIAREDLQRAKPGEISSGFRRRSSRPRTPAQSLSLALLLHLVRSTDSTNIARKIITRPAVASQMLHRPFGKMENRP